MSHVYQLNKIEGFISGIYVSELTKPDIFTLSICWTRKCKNNLRSLCKCKQIQGHSLFSYLTNTGIQRKCGCYQEMSLISMKTSIEKDEY